MKYNFLLFVVLITLSLAIIAQGDTTITDEELTTGGNVTSDYVFANGSFMSGVCHSNGDNCTASASDTNESSWVGNVTNYLCDDGNYSYGILANGTLQCRSDLDSGGGGGGDFDYNQTIGTFNQYGQWWYNQSEWTKHNGSTLTIDNITNFDFNYNMTLAFNNTEGWNVNFSNVEITNFYTPTGSFLYTIDDDGSNVDLSFPDVGGNNYVGLVTSGGFFQLYANPNPSNDFLLATISETQGATTELNFYEGGTGHNRFWDSGSARFGGDAGRDCDVLTTQVDCDTAGTGSDIVVMDDIWLGGDLIINGTGKLGNFSHMYSWDELNNTINLFDQELNTTSAVTFDNLTVKSNVTIHNNLIVDNNITTTGILNMNEQNITLVDTIVGVTGAGTGDNANERVYEFIAWTTSDEEASEAESKFNFTKSGNVGHFGLYAERFYASGYIDTPLIQGVTLLEVGGLGATNITPPINKRLLHIKENQNGFPQALDLVIDSDNVNWTMVGTQPANFTGWWNIIGGVNVTGPINSSTTICDVNGCIGSGSGLNINQGVNTTDAPTFDNITITRNLTVTQNTYIGGNFTVNGNVTLKESLNVSNEIIGYGGIKIGDPASYGFYNNVQNFIQGLTVILGSNNIVNGNLSIVSSAGAPTFTKLDEHGVKASINNRYFEPFGDSTTYRVFNNTASPSADQLWIGGQLRQWVSTSATNIQTQLNVPNINVTQVNSTEYLGQVMSFVQSGTTTCNTACAKNDDTPTAGTTWACFNSTTLAGVTQGGAGACASTTNENKNCFCRSV